MHEVSIAQSLLDAALGEAAKHDAHRIKTMRLRIGGLQQIVEESLRGAFEMLSCETMAEGAGIDIEWIPTVWRCGACGATVDEYAYQQTCRCGASQWCLEGSDELMLTSLELECDDED